MAICFGNSGRLGETPTTTVSQLRFGHLSCGGESSPDANPKPPPIRHSRHNYSRLIFVDVVTAVFCKLFDRIVVRKHVAMNTSEQGDGNFEDGNEQVICRIADLVITHR